MSSQNENGFKSFTASGALTAFTVVNVQTDGTIKVAANNTKGIGVLQEDAADGNTAISGSAVTAATEYGVITGGYVGTVTLKHFTALESAADGDGTVVEFQAI